MKESGQYQGLKRNPSRIMKTAVHRNCMTRASISNGLKFNSGCNRCVRRWGRGLRKPRPLHEPQRIVEGSTEAGVRGLFVDDE